MDGIRDGDGRVARVFFPLFGKSIPTLFELGVQKKEYEIQIKTIVSALVHSVHSLITISV